MPSDPTSSEYIGYRLEVVVGVFIPLQIVAVALRFYARKLTASGYGMDDWLVAASLLGQLVASGIAIGGVRQGAIGYHVGFLEETDPNAITLFFKYLVAISAWYYATISISKLAICMLYRRLFPQRPVYIVLYITTGIMVSTAIASLIADLAACDPFSANWASPDIQATHCINKEALFVWSTFPNIVTDVIMLLLPLPIIWRLHTPTQLKVALTCTFLLGSIGLIASILRFATFSNTNSFIDATYNAVELVIWTIAEPSVYLISACVLMYRPLLEKIGIGSLSSSSKASDSRAYKQHPGTESRRMGRALESGDRSIALRSLSANRGFEQLFDDERSIHGRDQFLRASITTTAHFQPPERGV